MPNSAKKNTSCERRRRTRRDRNGSRRPSHSLGVAVVVGGGSAVPAAEHDGALLLARRLRVVATAIGRRSAAVHTIRWPFNNNIIHWCARQRSFDTVQYNIIQYYCCCCCCYYYCYYYCICVIILSRPNTIITISFQSV